MNRTNPESWLHQDSKMVPCAQCSECTHNPMMLWLSVLFIEYNEYNLYCARRARARRVRSTLNLEPPLIKRGTLCQLDISGAILYCLSEILGLADKLCVS